MTKEPEKINAAVYRKGRGCTPEAANGRQSRRRRRWQQSQKRSFRPPLCLFFLRVLFPILFYNIFSLQVNKETSTASSLPSQRCSVVRPKERRPDVRQQNPFMRGNTIIRSKTFSPGPQSQYICRVTEAG